MYKGGFCPMYALFIFTLYIYFAIAFLGVSSILFYKSLSRMELTNLEEKKIKKKENRVCFFD